MIKILSEEEKWEYIISLDKELLLGGVILSEWSVQLIKDAEIAFCKGAYLASILSAQAGIECHLRYEYFEPKKTKNWGFSNLIDNSPLSDDIKIELHKIRKFRNKWVHVKDPIDDENLLSRPDYYQEEMEKMAKSTIKTMLRVIYQEQFV